jgi:hypothetical protein
MRRLSDMLLILFWFWIFAWATDKRDEYSECFPEREPISRFKAQMSPSVIRDIWDCRDRDHDEQES